MVEAIITAIIAAIIAGMFSLLRRYLDIRRKNEKEKEEEKENQAKLLEQEKIKKEEEFLRKEEKIIELGPRFEIIDFKESLDYTEDFDAIPDINSIFVGIQRHRMNGSEHMFFYDPKMKDKKNWQFIEYRLRNIGKTEIQLTCLATNLPRNTALHDVQADNHLYMYESRFLNYSVYSDKYVKPGEEIMIRVNYIKGQVVRSMLGAATLVLFSMDINDRYWEQPLFAPDNKMYHSKLIDRRTFQNTANIYDALKCFKDPMLW